MPGSIPGSPTIRSQPAPRPPTNLLVVAQAGRLSHQAVLLVESLRRSAPGWAGRVIVAEPRAAAAWDGHRTAIPAGHRALLERLGAEVQPFTAERFGASYPQGNKIEALGLLPAAQPFLFVDTDTLVTGRLDRADLGGVPTASMRRTGTWPRPPLYGPARGAIWKALYDRFGVDISPTLDHGFPADDWRRWLYLNAGWFCGPDPAPFHARYLTWADAVWRDPGDALASQAITPWLDQIVLPLVIASLGGGRPGPGPAALDGAVAVHWRTLPLLYAREDEATVALAEQIAHRARVRRLLKDWEPARRLIFGGEGRTLIRPIFADHPPDGERAIRTRLKRDGLWLT